jgi:hypothetical protein
MPFTYRYPVDSSVPTQSAIAAPILRERNGVKYAKVIETLYWGREADESENRHTRDERRK